MKIGYNYLLLFLITAFTVIACDPTAEELQEKYKDEAIAVSGISLDKSELNSFYSEIGKGVSPNDLFKAFSREVDKENIIKQADVIVDMSAGMNIGIDKSYPIISSVMKRFDPSHKTQYNYFHVDDAATIQPISGLNSLADAAILQNANNYNKSFSKLKPAFESASKSSNKISVIITDFLLDEGLKSDKRLKNGKFTHDETADNSTWARQYFTDWFKNDNEIIIYPFQYTANNYYGKNETKNIYYIFFVPKNCSNKDFADLKNDLSQLISNPIYISPSNINLKFANSAPEECIKDFSVIKNSRKKSKIFESYNTQVLAFSHPSLIKNSYSGKTASCIINVINKSPYAAKVKTESFDLSKVYYNALALSTEEWSKKDINYKSKDVIQNNDIIGQIVGDSSIQFEFAKNVVSENYMSAYKGYGKLVASRISISDLQLKDLDKRLSWNFESKYGTMVNDAFRESLRLSLDDYKSNVLGDNLVKSTLGSSIFTFHDK